jgi:hypothetical protein
MKVECVHLFFQSIYVGNQKFFSIPVADIAVKGKSLPRRVSLDRDLITRKNIREIRIGGNFFAVKTTSAFVIYSASGKKLDIIELTK